MVTALDSQDIRTLRVLEEVEGEGQPSQRELARKLGISVGLVNAFLKRLARKGYFKITNLPANRIRYILTPQGMAEKTRLTCEYVHYSFSYYRRTRERLQKIFSDLAQTGQLRIVFWGKGELAEIAYISLQEIPVLTLVAIIESGEPVGEVFGTRIMPPEGLGHVGFDRVIVTAISAVEEIRSSLRELGIPDHKILFL